MGRKLYVGNLPYTTGEQDLQDLFSQYGQVDSVSVMRDMATGRARGFAFVEMATDADAQKAITELHDKPFRRPQPDGQRGASAHRAAGRVRRERPRRPRAPAIILFTWLSKGTHEPIQVSSALLKGLAAALIGGATAYAVAVSAPGSAMITSLLGMIFGGLTALAVVWSEVRLLFHL